LIKVNIKLAPPTNNSNQTHLYQRMGYKLGDFLSEEKNNFCIAGFIHCGVGHRLAYYGYSADITRIDAANSSLASAIEGDSRPS
jgi:hypothetical protein